MMQIFEQSTLNTGAGAWMPLVFLIALILLFLIVQIIRQFGNSDPGKGTLQLLPFRSGNSDAPEGNIESNDLFWGFTESLKGVYANLIEIHTGVVTDYAGVFVFILAILMMVLLIS